MAEMTDAQKAYPNLNPYAGANGSKSTHPLNPSFPPQQPSNLPPPTIASHPTANGTMDSLANGPVAEKAKAEASATKDELSNLAAARTTPTKTTASGQTLTHYHSFFYELLSWNNPRATAIAYTLITTFIFATRYVPLVRWSLKGTYIILGITAAAEMAGKLVLGQGFATKMRPKRYYTLPRETMESVMEDLVELGNFFIIEFQRIVFAENIGATIATFLTALLAYFLIKITPAWGIALLFNTTIFFLPLIYIKNQALIDSQLSNAQDLLNKQASQVRDLANQHAGSVMETTQNAVKEYSAKASEMMGTAKKSAVENGVLSKETVEKLPGAPAQVDGAVEGNGKPVEVKGEDFPTAPVAEPVKMEAAAQEEKEPLLA